MTGTVIVAGAGIGGLTAALALAVDGFRVVVLEQAEQLADIGAGIQLTPNATRVLIDLGLRERLEPRIVAPHDVCIRNHAGDRLARVPLGTFAEKRYGAPYWVIHRADLQSVLLDAVRALPGVTLILDSEVEKFSIDGSGVSVHAVRGASSFQTHGDIGFDAVGLALIGADGLTSTVRYWLESGNSRLATGNEQPRYSNRTAWRATVASEKIPQEFREPRVHLWLSRNAHLVHYPVKGGDAVNMVAITRDDRTRPGWDAPSGAPAEVLAHFSDWSARARDLLAIPETWLRWPLFDRPPSKHWGHGPVTLLGDAAHPMLPFAAQGAAMAIEDAFALADCLRTTPDDPENALRRYEDRRQPRTAHVQRAAQRNGRIYHLGGLAAYARNFALRKISGEKLLSRFDWLYDWRLESVFNAPLEGPGEQ